mgnify:FL=1
MPTDRQVNRLLLGNGPYAPQGGYGGGSLQAMLLEQGRMRADAAMRSGELWGNALQQVGQQVSGAVMQHAEEKKLKKRDAAWLALVNDPEAMKDPRAVYASAVKVWGPEEGPKQFQALAAAHQLAQPKRDQAADTKALIAFNKGFKGLAPEARAASWGVARPLVKSAFGTDLPEQYDDEQYTKMWGPAIEALEPEKNQDFTLSPGQQRFGPDGKPIASVPAEVKPEPGFSLGPGETRYDSTGKPIASRPAAPKEPKRPDLDRIETVGPDGKPIITYVTPREGATYEKPTSQAKPSSGQQRKALNFFNRAKEADEITSALEESGGISPTRLKYTPDWANFAQSEGNQSYKAAQRAFTEARLRKESGAVVPEREYEKDEKTYFAQPGDSAAVKAQKRRARQEVLSGIAFEAGDAVREYYGDETDSILSRYDVGRQEAPTVKKNPFR